MSRQHLSDFEIGYDYVRKRYSFLAKHSSQHLWELGNAYLQTRGANAELSRGMGFYFLELGIKMRLAEITPAHKENLASAKPSGAGGSLSCTYAYPKVILSDSIRKTWLAPSLAKAAALVALMLQKVCNEVILSD